MMRLPYDIRTYKKKLRDRYKHMRLHMPASKKKTCDARIRGRILHLPEYANCDTLLCFVSTAIEVETHKLITRALADGKIVAAPRCVNGTRTMHFHRIRSLQDLSPGTFDVLEPDPETAERVSNFANSICVLPGLAFDRTGFRLGYGGGYYDRFLSQKYLGSGGVTVGVCYAECVAQRLPQGRFDVPCNILITEKYVRRFHQQSGGG